MNKKEKIISKYDKWVINSKLKVQDSIMNTDEIMNILLKNRGIKTKKQREEFFSPAHPEEISLKDLGIDGRSLRRAIRRILDAFAKKEKVIIFGDYDVDGISSSAILWEFLYSNGLDVTPYIPERFSEGYGIKVESIKHLKEKYPKVSLIITVDNGIVAFDAVKKANELGIDVLVLDHHEKGEKYPSAYSVIHTTKLCGAGIAWILVRELNKKMWNPSRKQVHVTQNIVQNTLELAVLGTVADQMPLVGVNRSIVKCGLEKLNNSTRVGLNALFDIAAVNKGSIGTYEINYMVAPRINAMGRLEHAIDSLRLICIKNKKKADELARLLNRTNLRRQKVVDEVLVKAKKMLTGKKMGQLIILEDESYHEGVIGLAASKLVEEFRRPAIVISKGKEISKGSARSIPGFSIIDAIKSEPRFLMSGGGHEMAAGFSIKSKDIPAFRKALIAYARKTMDKDILEKKSKIDLYLDFADLSGQLVEKIKNMEPFGIGNPAPAFATLDCEVADVRKVGASGNHLKFNLGSKGLTFDAISFNNANNSSVFFPGMRVDVLYNLEENVWNGQTSLQLKIKDLRYAI